MVETVSGHTLYNPEQIIAKNKGDTPLTYQKLTSLISSLGHPDKPLDAPDSLDKDARCSSKEAEKTKYDPPSLKDLGVEVGDSIALVRMGSLLALI